MRFLFFLPGLRKLGFLSLLALLMKAVVLGPEFLLGLVDAVQELQCGLALLVGLLPVFLPAELEVVLMPEFFPALLLLQLGLGDLLLWVVGAHELQTVLQLLLYGTN